jgi:hypothetical protein
MNAMDRAEQRTQASAAEMTERRVQAIAEGMIAQPRTILMALCPYGKWEWPHPDLSLAQLRARTTVMIAANPDLIGLFEVVAARRALDWMIAAQGEADQDAARRTP